MLLKRKNVLFVLILITGVLSYTYSFAACFGGGIDIPKFSKKSGIYIETDIKPSSRFEEARIKSIAVLKFDAKYVKSKGGEIIDYIDLSNRFTDDLLKRFYEIGKVDVALGEYEDRVIETDILEKKRGDLEVQGNILKRSIEYKAAPYKKIETVLSGRVNKYQMGDDWKHSFIDVTLKLTDTYSGTVYWITDIRGYEKDVVETIVQSVVKGKYTEPLPVKKIKDTVKKKVEKETKKEEPEKKKEKKEEK